MARISNTRFNVSIIDDNGVETKIGHTLVSALKMDKPTKLYTDEEKNSVGNLTATLRINKWNMFKLNVFMKRVHIIAWFKSKFNKHLEINIDRE